MRRIWVPTDPLHNINCWIADGDEVRYYPKSRTGFRDPSPSRNTVEDMERMVRDGTAKELPDDTITEELDSRGSSDPAG